MSRRVCKTFIWNSILITRRFNHLYPIYIAQGVFLNNLFRIFTSKCKFYNMQCLTWGNTYLPLWGKSKEINRNNDVGLLVYGPTSWHTILSTHNVYSKLVQHTKQPSNKLYTNWWILVWTPTLVACMVKNHIKVSESKSDTSWA